MFDLMGSQVVKACVLMHFSVKGGSQQLDFTAWMIAIFRFCFTTEKELVYRMTAVYCFQTCLCRDIPSVRQSSGRPKEGLSQPGAVCGLSFRSRMSGGREQLPGIYSRR